MDTYDVGDVARLDLEELLDAEGVPSDPATVKFMTKAPDGTEGEVTPVKDKTGYYHAVKKLTMPGTWLYRWVTEGGVTVTEGGVLPVRVSGFEDFPFTSAPTAGLVRQWSRMEFDDLEFEWEEGQSFDPLEPLVQRAVAWLQNTVGRRFADLVLPTEPVSPTEEELETWREEVLAMENLQQGMRRAVVMLTEFDAAASQPDIAETAADFGMIQSFSAGNYSETRRSGNRNLHNLHPWQALDELLWELLNPKRKSRFNEGPAISTDSPPYWRTGAEIMGYTDEILTPFGRFQYPWDAVLSNLL